MQPVFYVYPDGLFPKKEKRARLERAYGKGTRAPAGKAGETVKEEQRTSPGATRIPDEKELRDFYYDGEPYEGDEKLARGQYDPADFRPKVYKVGFDSPPEGGGTFAEAAPPPRSRAMEDKRRDDVGDAKKRASARRKFIQRKRGLLLALTIILFLILLVFGFYKLVFVVRNIYVDGNLSTYTQEEIIEASGVRQGVNLYSFRASATDSKVTFKLPYVERVEVKRSPPGTVMLNVTEDVPKYSAEIFGKTVILSDGLRILDTLAEGEQAPEDLVRLKLPAVSYSVEGRLIGFAGEKDERSIRATLEAAAGSNMEDRISTIDLRDLYNIEASCDGKYLLVFGSSTDIDVKFATAAKVLEDELFSSGNKARINLSDPSKASVVFDGSIEID
ncbi:MAG: FtsQ-type POTRA domain-containing protein [Clostridia bacterium]|nr:FtsQ-type POTRA domain-containing protein [Clostridia bacterium]